MTDEQRYTRNMLTYELARRDARNRVLLILAAVVYVLYYMLMSVPIDVWQMLLSMVSGAVKDAGSVPMLYLADVVLDHVVLSENWQ